MAEEVAQLPTFYYYVLRETEISSSRKWNTIEDAISYAERRASNHNEPFVIFGSDRILKPVTPKIEMNHFRFDWDVNFKKREAPNLTATQISNALSF